MGCRYEFRCTRCGYTAEVEGGYGAGFLMLVKTQVCNRCSKVVDVAIEFPLSAQKKYNVKLDENDLNRCPNCRSRDLREWTNHQCPKCGGRMKKGEPGPLWD